MAFLQAGCREDFPRVVRAVSVAASTAADSAGAALEAADDVSRSGQA